MSSKVIITLLFFATTNHLLCFYNYPQPIEGYYSQKGQDKFLNEIIFKGKKGGFFVEVGAHDGISFSNTYFSEKHLGWTGMCIEPNPSLFPMLQANRTCMCIPACIANSITKKPFLLCSGYILEMYSGLLNDYDPRHLGRINTELEKFGGNKQVITINCCTLKMLFETYGIDHIDLLSIDIEGGEKEALESIDFTKVIINVILVEDNFGEKTLKNYLEEKGYLFSVHIGKDDVYIREGCVYGA